jgi:hypothetical protein
MSIYYDEDTPSIYSPESELAEGVPIRKQFETRQQKTIEKAQQAYDKLLVDVILLDFQSSVERSAFR